MLLAGRGSRPGHVAMFTKRRRLSTQLFAMQFVVLALTLGIGFVLAMIRFQSQLDTQFEHRALGVAQTVAATDPIADLVEARDPGGSIAAIASGIRQTTGARYVVITDKAGIRYSHPNPRLIGQPVQDDPEPPDTEPIVTGKAWTGIQIGTLGRTARGKAPIFDNGRVVGEVSVGFPISGITAVLFDSLPGFATYMLIALGVGTALSLLLARRLKRQTFGLELDEIATLLQQREATLHGIREGVIGMDMHGRIKLANGHARRMLGLGEDCNERELAEFALPDRLRALLADPADSLQTVLLMNSQVLVANKRPVLAGRKLLGHVLTLHDRTESEGLMRELEAVLGLTEALRAQSHDFLNRLHTMLGLVELEEYGELRDYITNLSDRQNHLVHRLALSIGDPLIVALLLAKTAVAAERRVDLRIAQQTQIDGVLRDADDVITIVGNLVDNAIDAAAGRPDAWVRVLLRSVGRDLHLVVADSGPGIPDGLRATVFSDGYSTKASRAAHGAGTPDGPAPTHQGLGLALVRQLVLQRNGSISLSNEVGAIFTVLLPACVDPAQRKTLAINACDEPGCRLTEARSDGEGSEMPFAAVLVAEQRAATP